MSKLMDIPVRVEFDRPRRAQADVVKQVLHDIHAALSDFHARGQTHAIDVRQLPRLSAERYRELREALGQGEVSAMIQAEIKVEVSETQFPGVWWLRHFNSSDDIATEIIEISDIPTILKPHSVDIQAGLNKLSERLQMRDIESAATPASS